MIGEQHVKKYSEVTPQLLQFYYENSVCNFGVKYIFSNIL